MNENEKIEKLIFKISLWAGIVFVVLEVIMALISRSQTVLMDAAYDAAELVVITGSLLLTPLFYRPVTEKRPFGYFQCESLFIIIKGFMMISVTFSLMFSNIQILLSGGNHVDSIQIFSFELCLAVMSLLVLLVLRHYNSKISSPSAAAEQYGWKVDFLCSFGVSLAFLMPPLFADTSLAWLAPYFDQIVAIVLVAFVIPEPIKMIVVAFRDLLLFSPPQEITDDVRQRIDEVFAAHDYATVFVDVTQTGRQLWVAVSFTIRGENLSMSELKAVQTELTELLDQEYDAIEVELIPVADAPTLTIAN